MMKKYLLKGKEFIMKKMEELDMSTQEIDYVAEQIPRRLRDRLRILENADYDLQPASSYANYFRTYPNHPISSLLTERMKEQKPVEYKLKAALVPQQTSIPQFDAALQRKAMTFKHVVDSYDEGLPQLQGSPLVCICVVHFHHKRGTEMEYRYPFNETVEKLQARIIHNAMPDSSHNKAENYNYFNLEAEIEGRRRMLFGVSYFKQIKVTETMKAKNEELTRSHLQKAVCVVSLLPVFGYLKGRLAPTTKIFFNDFTNFQSVKHAYMDINKHLVDSWKKLQLSEINVGSDLRSILRIFKYKFFELYKAVLQQKRIIVFSHSSSSSSSFILSLLSLFPGMLTFGMHSEPIDRYLEGLRQYALPLKLFSSDNPLILSFHIQDFHLLDRFKKKDVRGNYLIGTTNRLIKESKNHGIQVMVNLEESSVEFIDAEEDEPWEGISKAERAFVDEMLEVLDEEFTCGYEGSEDWIRDRFHSYLKEKLAEFVDVKNKYLKFLVDCRQYTSKRKKSGSAKLSSNNKESYQTIEDEDEQMESKKSRQSVPIVDQSILQIPLVGLLGKAHFMYFLQFHNPNLYLLTEQYPVGSIITIDNFQYYLGCLPKKDSGEHITYNVKSQRLRFGNGQKSNKIKELKFDQNNEIAEVYVGGSQQSKYHGQGYILTENESYQGDFLEGSKHGLGKLTTPCETYIGGFEHGLYCGQGQLVTKDGSIYSGHFKEGVKEGQGRLQKAGMVYEGDFQQNEMWGRGNITYEAERRQIFGPFVKGKLDECEECVIKYSNGDAYAGRVRDMKANGQGTLRRSTGELLEGGFLNDKLIGDG